MAIFNGGSNVYDGWWTIEYDFRRLLSKLVKLALAGTDFLRVCKVSIDGFYL